MWTPDSWNHNKGALVRESQEVNGTWPGEGMETQWRTASFGTYSSMIHSQGRTDIGQGDNKMSKLGNMYLFFTGLVPLMGVGMQLIDRHIQGRKLMASFTL